MLKNWLRKMNKTYKACGYYMTKNQVLEVREWLKNDIIMRYDNEEYWNLEIVEAYAQEHGLKKFKKGGKK